MWLGFSHSVVMLIPICIMTKVSTTIEWFVACTISHSSNFFVKICWQLLELSAKFAKLSLSCGGNNSFKKLFDLDPELDDFQKLMVTSLSKDTSLAKLSWSARNHSVVVLILAWYRSMIQISYGLCPHQSPQVLLFNIFGINHNHNAGQSLLQSRSVPNSFQISVGHTTA